MNLLLDTQALLWWRQGSRRLGRRARQAIGGIAPTVVVSAATAWEISIKWQDGALRLPDPPRLWIEETCEAGGFSTLPVSIEHAVGVASLPQHHCDPFDRLLIVQAQLGDLTIVTSDTAFGDYDVKLLDARR
jgi:PIN domain nuclease of toxin-antitoxin system